MGRLCVPRWGRWRRRCSRSTQDYRCPAGPAGALAAAVVGERSGPHYTALQVLQVRHTPLTVLPPRLRVARSRVGSQLPVCDNGLRGRAHANHMAHVCGRANDTSARAGSHARLPFLSKSHAGSLRMRN
eukprot:3071586-Prymnesium_polylepis.1